MDYENNMMNEEMVNEEIEVNPANEAEPNSGMGTVITLAIGAGLAVATGAAVKLGKKLWGKYKSHKELRKPELVEPIEPTDAEIAEIVEEEDAE